MFAWNVNEYKQTYNRRQLFDPHCKKCVKGIVSIDSVLSRVSTGEANYIMMIYDGRGVLAGTVESCDNMTQLVQVFVCDFIESVRPRYVLGY